MDLGFAALGIRISDETQILRSYPIVTSLRGGSNLLAVPSVLNKLGSTQRWALAERCSNV